MRTLKITGMLLCIVMPVYLIISFVGPSRLGFQENHMITLRTISWITLVLGNLMILFSVSNNRKELNKRLLFMLLMILLGLGAVFLA